MNFRHIRKRVAARRSYRPAGDIDDEVRRADLRRELLDMVGVGQVGDDEIAGLVDVGGEDLRAFAPASLSTAWRRFRWPRRDQRLLPLQSLKRHRRRR